MGDAGCAPVVGACPLGCVSGVRLVRGDGAAPRWSRLAPALGFAVPVVRRGGRRPEAARNCCRAWATQSTPPWWRLDCWDTFLVWGWCEGTALRRGGRGFRLRSGSQCPTSEEAAGGLRPRATAAAHGRRGAAPRGDYIFDKISRKATCPKGFSTFGNGLRLRRNPQSPRPEKQRPVRSALLTPPRPPPRAAWRIHSAPRSREVPAPARFPPATRRAALPRS